MDNVSNNQRRVIDQHSLIAVGEAVDKLYDGCVWVVLAFREDCGLKFVGNGDASETAKLLRLAADKLEADHGRNSPDARERLR